MDFTVSQDNKTIYRYKGNDKELVIPEGIEIIDAEAFSKCKSLVKIVFPSSLKKICKWSFGKCVSLVNVVFNDDLCEIGEFAFADCPALNDVTLNEGLKSIGECAFRGCISISKIVIPDSVEYIAPRTFENCTNLRTVVIGNGVKKIEDYTFWNCSSLENVKVCNNSDIIIGSLALFNCGNATVEHIVDEEKKQRAEELAEKKRKAELERAEKKRKAELERAEKERVAALERSEKEKKLAIEAERAKQIRLDNELKQHGLNGYYEYMVLSIVDNKGALDPYDLQFKLNELGRVGWHVVGSYANELGHNSTSGGVLGISAGTNSTVDQNVIILERFKIINE